MNRRKKLNPIIYKENYAIIRTSSGKDILVDLEDVPLLSKFTWCVNKHGYAITVIITDGKRESILMHRLLLNPSDGQLVDHINHNTLDNRKANLRIVSQAQNQMNQVIRKDNKSGFKGVHWHKCVGKWSATIRYNTRKIYLGCFENINDAIEARVKAEQQYFGEYRYMEVE